MRISTNGAKSGLKSKRKSNPSRAIPVRYESGKIQAGLRQGIQVLRSTGAIGDLSDVRQAFCETDFVAIPEFPGKHCALQVAAALSQLPRISHRIARARDPERFDERVASAGME